MAVFTKISNVVRRSNIRWHARSFAASVPSAMPQVQKVQKKLSRDERRAMVVSFVNKYREVNAGKFPSVSLARKNLGGSYYVIRKIVQELEYQSLVSPIKTGNEDIVGKEVAKENKSSMDEGIRKDAQEFAVNDVDVCDYSLKHSEPKKGSQTSVMVEETLSEEVLDTRTGDYSNFVATKSQLLKEEAKEEYHPCPEKAEEDVNEKTSNDMLELEGPNLNTKQHQQSPELDMFVGEKQTGDQQLPKDSSVWGNLKSFANGIFNMWRKL
ncbi:uncharacterized protein LOC132307780 [Cornus florida]|uniref:uncharacterized protein LOC132307780 n=1 Tax=Cornus florida TaxID=4283 RepID=UPI0028975600|nr:uncharacterized protein LOC132307780 [Cornus florida]